MALPASLPGKERGQSVKAEAFVCIPHVKDKGTAVDVEILPLVLCKDCDHWNRSTGHCAYNSIFTNAEFFCADGERTEKK